MVSCRAAWAATKAKPISLCVESPMVSAGSQVSLLKKHGGHSPCQLFSLSLVEAKDGLSTFPLSRAGEWISSNGFHVTFQWLNFMQLAQ